MVSKLIESLLVNTFSHNSNLLNKILENFYDKNKVPINERTCAEDYYFEDNENNNLWLKRFIKVWEKSVYKMYKEN